MERYGQVIRIRPGKLNEYREYHERAWPEVLAMIARCNIHS
jgi:L-rhamnose mutarotase